MQKRPVQTVLRGARVTCGTLLYQNGPTAMSATSSSWADSLRAGSQPFRVATLGGQCPTTRCTFPMAIEVGVRLFIEKKVLEEAILLSDKYQKVAPSRLNPALLFPVPGSLRCTHWLTSRQHSPSAGANPRPPLPPKGQQQCAGLQGAPRGNKEEMHPNQR